MRYVGLDLHKRALAVCALDRRGEVAFRETGEYRREAPEAFARTRLRKTDRLAVEATTDTRAVADILRPSWPRSRSATRSRSRPSPGPG